MTNVKETIFPNRQLLGKKLAITITACLGLSQQALAHIEYYDLNQGIQIGDLTIAGIALSTLQYGLNPEMTGPGINVNRDSDRPLNDPVQWTTANQTYKGLGTFTNLIYTPSSSSATLDVQDVTEDGWGKGTHTGLTGTLGDSHKVDFLNFRLSKKSTVTITWNVDDNEGGYIDNGFTLYKGVLSYQGHDYSTEQLNPRAGGVKFQAPLDTGSVFDAQGIASAYRNTTPGAPEYIGQFNALASWGDGNPNGNWSNIEYIQAVNAKNPVAGFSSTAADTLESLTIVLNPGNYTIAASGAINAVGYDAYQGSIAGSTLLHGHLTFNATEVPGTCP